MQKVIVGIDEAGRGPLAGPVVAVALVILNTKYNILNTGTLRDSKKLSAKQRERIFDELYDNSGVEWGIGQVSEKQIDKINIFQATKLAMKRAFHSLSRKLSKIQTQPALVIIDGTSLIDISISQKAIIRADATIVQCMAASIIAKVTRDRYMQKLHKQYPQYGFDRHKGYGTQLHMEMLEKHGPCPVHRRSFAPIRQVR